MRQSSRGAADSPEKTVRDIRGAHGGKKAHTRLIDAQHKAAMSGPRCGHEQPAICLHRAAIQGDQGSH